MRTPSRANSSLSLFFFIFFCLFVFIFLGFFFCGLLFLSFHFFCLQSGDNASLRGAARLQGAGSLSQLNVG